MIRRRFLQMAAAAASAPWMTRAATDGGAFEFGLAADAQYADIEPKGTRYYRAGVPRLAEAVEHFNARDLAFCVHLGDLIDREWRSFDDILAPLEKSRHRWHQLLGNHDFDVLDEYKSRVPQRLGMGRRYGAFEHRDYRFVILDTNDVSTYAYAAGTPQRAEAERELARLQAAQLDQAKPWNGGVGAAQLAWFERTCAEARAAQQKVVIFAHHPVFPHDRHVVWNADEMLAAIDRHPNIVAWFNGHNHAGNFGERNGVSFVNLRGMVETADTNAFATARVLPDRILLAGHGREPSRELVLRK